MNTMSGGITIKPTTTYHTGSVPISLPFIYSPVAAVDNIVLSIRKGQVG